MSVELAPWLLGSHWPTIQIRYVAKLGTGHTPSRQHPEYWENCTVPWMTLADVWQLRNGKVDVVTETTEKISVLGLANSAAVKHPAGTVILSRTASVGFSAILGTDMATSQDFATWTCSDLLYPRYLLHCLRAMTPDLRRLAAGSTHKTIYMPDIAQLRIPLPPPEEQRRIADFLDAEAARIGQLSYAQEAVLRLVGERKRSLLEFVLVSRFGELEIKWEWKPLAALTDPERPIMYGIVLPGPNVHGGIPIVKGGDIGSGRLAINLLNRTSREIESRYARSRLRGGDLVIAIRGSVGEVGVVPDELSGANLTQDAARISIGSEVDPRWLELVLQAPSVVAQIEASTTGATVKGINIRDLKRIKIPTPKIDGQRLLSSMVDGEIDKHSNLRTVIERQLSVLAERRQALITAAVTGQLAVSTTRGYSQ